MTSLAVIESPSDRPMTLAPTLEDVRAARVAIHGIAVRSPLGRHIAVAISGRNIDMTPFHALVANPSETPHHA